MTTLVKIGIGVAIVATVVVIVPALKGPYNRFKNTANDKLNAEFVVDNYKAEYVNLFDKKQEILKAINKFKLEQAVTYKKLDQANKEATLAKKKLLETGTSDLKAFQRSKNIYELANTKVNNFNTMINTYSNALVKLELSLNLIEINMQKAQLNVDTLASKKTMVDAIKNVNKSVEDLNGVGDSNIGINIEKLNEDELRESIRLEVLNENNTLSIPMDQAQAQAYLDSLK